MHAAPTVLVIAATARELATSSAWVSVTCGVGPVDAAAATTAAIAAHAPALILHVGIAGARQHRGLAPATLVVGSSAVYCDADASAEWLSHTVNASPELLRIAQQTLPNAITLPIGTSARVGGSQSCDIEAMEGFGVLRAAQRYGIPALEVRAISNEIEEPDRARWHFDAAFEAINSATPLLVHALRHHL